MNYVFMTDSDSDLPFALKEEWQIPVVSMPFMVDGQEYFDDLGQTLNSKDFYDKMRAGAKVTTAALNAANYIDYFEPYLKEGRDILFIAFSSSMSATLKAAEEARQELLETYPERKIRIVDTLTICAPMTILLWKAHELYAQGADMETVATWVEENRMRSHAFFTVDDLEYLKRGGRITGTVAAVGKLLDLKPILVINRDGMVVSHSNVRGRKRALNTIVDKTVENMLDETEAPCIVVHADALADAELVKKLLQARLPKLSIRIENVGPVIGAHAGPGTVAVSFLGKERTV